MTQAEIQHHLYEEIDMLSAAEQMRLLVLARDLRSATPKGTPWSEIKHLAGTLPAEDAQEIMTAIEEGCEHIDLHEW